MIRRIRIQNFRSLLDVTVDLEPVTVLIGRAGTGKSNFVRAIRYLRDCLAAGSGGKHNLRHVDSLDGVMSFEVEFSAGNFGPARYLLRFAPSSDVLGEQLEVRRAPVFHHEHGRWITEPAVAPRPAATGVQLGAIAGLESVSDAYVALRRGLGCYDFPGAVIGARNGSTGSSELGLLDDGSNYLAAADRILADLDRSHWKRIRNGLRAINHRLSGLTADREVTRLSAAFEESGRTTSFEVSDESEGFRRYLAHLLALYQTPPKQTLLFEHPETGLHPGALEALATEFKQCPKEGRGQVILTTHSPQLLDYFPPEAIRVVEMHDGKTRIGPLTPEQVEPVKKRLLFPGELLTVDPARMAEAPEEAAV